jgi:hypothetical protein
MAAVTIASAEEFTQCDCMIWSGTLFRTAAIARIGLPRADYMLDIAELEDGYESRQLQFTGYGAA